MEPSTPSKPQYKKAYIDLPHFSAERKLTSCLKANPAPDGSGMFIEMQKGEPTGAQKIAGKYNDMEVAYLWSRFGAYLQAKAYDALPE